MKMIKNTIYLLLILTVMLPVIHLSSCGKKNTRYYKIGVLNVVPTLDQTFTGFKEGMSELGYREGENVSYIYNGAAMEMERLSGEAEILLGAGVDLILSITTPATLAAKKATDGTGVPVVFTVVTDPIGAGIVKNVQHPGGNITGVSFGIAEARRLEWLVRIASKIKYIYVPYNPKDKSPVLALNVVRKAADKLGVKLIIREIRDQKTLNDAVLNIPEKAEAVFHLPDSLIGTRLKDLVAAANKRRLPTSAANILDVKNYQMLISYGFDQNFNGKQTARLAGQILKGTRPADLPVEMTEFFLAINLKTAKAIGLTIPEDILLQAHIIVR